MQRALLPAGCELLASLLQPRTYTTITTTATDAADLQLVRAAASSSLNA
ncbi:hypothetical protein ACXC9Q_25825 (plasmid) [Kribbella sp. CWNU-51]|nr:hypothetical protein [Kribbella sp. NBC_01484]